MTRQADYLISFLTLILRAHVGGDMKEIQLTQGKIALVDDCEYRRFNQHKWYAQKNGKTFYAGRYLPRVNGRCRRMLMHHDVIGYPPQNFVNDHRDGNGLNNQRHNLRFVTNRQNGQNRKNERSSSQFPGVYWHKQAKKWKAQISTNGNIKHLGLFLEEEEAFKAYCHAVEDFGEEMLEGAKI